MFFRKRFNEQLLLKEIYDDSRLKRYLEFVFGVILIALAFNIFVMPSKMIYGISGLSIIFNDLFKWDPAIVILIFSILLLGLSFITLGFKKTKNTIIGSFLYPVFVELTAWIPAYLDLGTTEPVVIAGFGAILSGVGLGLVFRAGFTTGGTDVLNQIVSTYGKVSLGTAMIFTDGLIILAGIFTFGLQSLMYSIISIYIISYITDKVMLGISKYKTFYIITNEEEEVEDFLTKGLTHGITYLDARGSFGERKKKVIMCTVPTKEYFIVKEAVNKIDDNAFFIVTDAYEVKGGA